MSAPTGDPPPDLFATESSIDLVDQFYFIDMSLEDDSLLPVPNKEETREFRKDVLCSPAVSKALNLRLDVGATQAATSLQENLSRNQQGETSSSVSDQTMGVEYPRLSEEPVSKNKKKHGFNLRKSIAWNSAFLTEDGVLDSEELSLVNTTFDRIAEPAKPTARGQTSRLLKPVIIPKLKVSSITSQKVSLTAVSQQKLPEMTTASSPRSSEDSLEHQPSSAHGSSGIRHGGSSTNQPLVLADHLKLQKPTVSSQIDVGKNGSEKRNAGPGFLASGANGAMEINKHETKGRSDAFTFQSVSMKGTAQLKPVGVNRRFSNLPKKAEVNKNQKAVTLGCTTKHHPQHVSTAEKLATSINAANKTATLEKPSISVTDRPSGLRMPSPKLGFFDTSRMASQGATCHTENRAGQKDMSKLYSCKQNHGPKIPTTLIYKSRQQVKEHPAIKATAIMTPFPSSSSIMSGSLHNISNQVISPLLGAIQELSTNKSSSNLQGSTGVALNLNKKEAENPTQVLQAKINIHSNVSPLTKMTDLCSVRDASGQENSYPDFQDNKNGVMAEKLDDQDVVIP